MWTMSAATLEQKHRRTVESVVREADHLAVFRAAWVRTPQREFEEDVDGRDEEQVREEDL